MNLNYRVWLWAVLLLITSCSWGQTFVQLARRTVVRPVSDAAYDSYLTVSGNYLYFVGNDVIGNTGSELWRTDGTPAGTQSVKGVTPKVLGSVQGLQDVQGTLFFTPAGGRELWKTDGSEAGTVQIKACRDIIAVGTVYKNLLFFAPSPVDGGGLWRTDGTPGGTFQLSPINNSAATFRIYQDVAYFWYPAPNSEETVLMRTDGTLAGTTLVKQLPGLLQSIQPGVDGLYITLSRNLSPAVTEYAEWRSNGTPAGTVQIAPYSATVPIPGYARVYDDLYRYEYDRGASAVTSISRQNKTTGAFEAVSPLPNINLLLSTNINVQYRGQIYGPDFKPATGVELCRLDGMPIRDIRLGPASGSTYARPAVVNDQMYFPGDDGTTGLELWKTDGTAGGTRLVADLLPGSEGSVPLDLTVFRNELYMVSRDGTLLKLTSDTPATTGTLAFQVLAYDCNTGVLRYRLTGGNGSPIALNLPGVFSGTVQANAELSYSFPPIQRQGLAVTGTATQSGQVLPVTFLLGCASVLPTPVTIAPALINATPAAYRTDSPAHPNPARDVLMVNLGDALSGVPTVVLTDVLGRTHETASHLSLTGAGTLRLSVGHLPTGVYLLRVGQAQPTGGGSPARTVRFFKE